MSKFVLPYEPQYTGHRAAKRPQKDVRHSLRRHEREMASPALVPEPTREDDKTELHPSQKRVPSTRSF